MKRIPINEGGMIMGARQQIQPNHHPQHDVRKKEKQVLRYRARITFGEKVIAGFCAAILFVMLSFIVHNYSTLYGLNVSIQSVQQKNSVVASQNEGLKTELAELSAPENVMRKAANLGMKPPGEHN